MPPLHRWWGNPMFSFLARWWFRAPIHDVYCGLRGFTKAHYETLDQRCTGMEFATEMIIKSSLRGARVAEVPITLHPDGRKAHAPHLRTFRDGWRTLRFFMLYSPRWLFLAPGLLLMFFGALFSAMIVGGTVRVGGFAFDVHSLLYAAMAIIIGFQSVAFALFSKMFAIGEGLLPEDSRLNFLFRYVTLETGIVAGTLLLLAGMGGTFYALGIWSGRDFGALDPFRVFRIVIPSATAITLGSQIILSSFFMSILGLRRK
jgi:hypothetical protein